MNQTYKKYKARGCKQLTDAVMCHSDFPPQPPNPPASLPAQLLGPLSADSTGDEFLPLNCLQMKGDAWPQAMSLTTSQFSSNGGTMLRYKLLALASV